MDEQWIFLIKANRRRKKEMKGQVAQDTKLLHVTYDEMIDIIVLPQRGFVILIIGKKKKMSLPWIKSFIHSIFDIRRS